jgi:hypothetical protein
LGDRTSEDERRRLLIHSFPTLTATLATPQSAAAIAAWAITCVERINELLQGDRLKEFSLIAGKLDGIGNKGLPEMLVTSSNCLNSTVSQFHLYPGTALSSCLPS